MYEILLSNEAKNYLNSLNQKVKERIGSALERIKIRPHHFVKRLYNSKFYRMRIDDHRLILDIQDTHLIIYVIEIGLRGSIYRKY